MHYPNPKACWVLTVLATGTPLQGFSSESLPARRAEPMAIIARTPAPLRPARPSLDLIHPGEVQSSLQAGEQDDFHCDCHGRGPLARALHSSPLPSSMRQEEEKPRSDTRAYAWDHKLEEDDGEQVHEETLDEQSDSPQDSASDDELGGESDAGPPTYAVDAISPRPAPPPRRAQLDQSEELEEELGETGQGAAVADEPEYPGQESERLEPDTGFVDSAEASEDFEEGAAAPPILEQSAEEGLEAENVDAQLLAAERLAHFGNPLDASTEGDEAERADEDALAMTLEEDSSDADRNARVRNNLNEHEVNSMAGSDDLWDYQDDEGDGEEAPMKANDGYVYGPIEGEDVHAVPETFYDYSSSDDAESSDFAALDGEVGDYPAGQGEHHASLYNDSPADDAAGLIAKDHPGDRRLRADDEEASDNISPSKAPKNFFYHDPPHDH